MAVHPAQRRLLVQLLGVAVVGADFDRALKEERLVEAVQLPLNRLRGTLGDSNLVANGGLPRLPDLQHGLLE